MTRSERLAKLTRLRDLRAASGNALQELADVAHGAGLPTLQMIARATAELLWSEAELTPNDAYMLAGCMQVHASLACKCADGELAPANRDELAAAVNGASNALRALAE